MTTLQSLEARVDELEAGLAVHIEKIAVTTDDTRGQVEKINRNMATILDISTINGRLDSIAAVSSDTRTALDRLEKKAVQHDKRFDAVDKRFDAVDKRFDAVDTRLAGHDRRFDVIETRLAEHDVRFDAIDTELKSLHGDVTELKGDVTELKGDVGTLKTGMARVLELLEARA